MCLGSLPADFLIEMKELLLGEAYGAFLESYSRGRTYGLRYNPLKTDREYFLQKVPLHLKEIPWAEEGFFYCEEEQPGKRVLHEAGVYYIQEPSAMAAVQYLDPQPGETVLDLCAAPGGKSTQIAGRMKGEGLLISNEIIPSRCRILSQNVERMGIANCIVTGEEPQRLQSFFPAFFDKILVDAPCSGEGMFRKEPEAIREWSRENVHACAKRQDMILDCAAVMLKPGGVLVYSTCTFSAEEDEECTERFLQRHPEYILEESRKMWPHEIQGEGHYIARFKKSGTTAGSVAQSGLSGDEKLIRDLTAFLQDELQLETEGMHGRVVCFGEQIYLVPHGVEDFRGMKVERPGLHIAVQKKNRMEPAHALAMAMNAFSCRKLVELTHEEAVCFMAGGTVVKEQSALTGWCVVAVEGYTFGIAKISNHVLKNHYPKGLRKDVIF